MEKLTEYEKQKIADIIKGMSEAEILVVLNALNERFNIKYGSNR